MPEAKGYPRKTRQNDVHAPDVRRTPEVSDEPRAILAVDPGGAHVGVAIWTARDGVHSKEVDAENWLRLFELICPHVDLVLIEKFVLYPGKAKSLSWSPMETAEMIGAMKWIAGGHKKPVVMQGADIKIPTRRQCKARAVRWWDRSGHASDARLHLYHHLIRHDLIMA